jgi:hypothetical protein
MEQIKNFYLKELNIWRTSTILGPSIIYNAFINKQNMALSCFGVGIALGAMYYYF